MGFGLEFDAKPGNPPRASSMKRADSTMAPPGRRMNGDEYHIKLTDDPSIRRVKLYSYR